MVYNEIGSSYSLNERVVGTWIDGSILYEKTVDIGTLPNATSKAIAHNISNLKFVVKISGITMTALDGTGRYIPLSQGDPTNNAKSCVAIGVTENGMINISTGLDRRNYVYSYVTLQYTKTSD